MTRSDQSKQGAALEEPGLLVLALWFGIGGAMVEVAIHLLRRFVRHRFMFMSDDVIWMGPVMDTGLLLVVGLAVALVQRRRHRPAADGLIPVFGFFAALGILISYPRLHWSADVVLALGIAYQVTRIIRRRRPAFDRLVRRTLPLLLALVVVCAGSLYGARWWQQRPSAAPPPPGAPNVVLIILDTVRGLDFQGGSLLDRFMPRLARRAEQGVRFDRAFAASSWTLPSHASLFTGRWPTEHRANWNSPLDHTYPTLAETLASEGYETAGFIANKEYVSRESGLARGFRTYHDYLIGPGEFIRSSAVLQLIGQNLNLRKVIRWYESLGRKDADRINQQALSWLAREHGRPFFLFLNYFDAHTPYLPPAPFDSTLKQLPEAGGKDPGRRFRSTWQQRLPPGPIMEESRTAYAAALAYLDDRVTALLDSLDARLPGNTLVILAADHGEEFGEHGAMGHGHNVYRTTVQVPLIIWRDGEPARRVEAPVSLRDVPATVMAAAGITASPFPGRSLLDPASDLDSVRSELVWVPGLPPDYGVGDSDQISWIVDSIRVIERVGGKRDTFPVFEDPFEGGNQVNP